MPRFLLRHRLFYRSFEARKREDGDKERAIVLRLNAEKQAAEPGAKAK